MNQETTKQELQQDQSQEPDVCGEGLDDAAAVNDRQPEEAEAAETAIDTEEGAAPALRKRLRSSKAICSLTREKSFNKKKER
ncbi:MAG: hypothetical protein ACLRVS_01445 [Lachnospiraceae bacterium]